MIFLCVLSALLAYLSFPNILFPFGLPFCSWFFVLPLLLYLEETPPLGRLIGGMVFSVFLYIPLVSWLLSYSIMGFIFFVILLSLQPVLFCVLYKPKASMKRWYGVYVPALWVATEFIRSQLMSGFTWGISYTAAFDPLLLQVVPRTGTFGLSFIIILVNHLIFRAIIERTKRVYFMVTVSLLWIVLYGYGKIILSLAPFHDASSKNLYVCSLEPHIPFKQDLSEEDIPFYIEEQKRLTQQCFDSRQPDLIVWPETAIPLSLFDFPEIHKDIQNFSARMSVPFLIGTIYSETGKIFNSAVWISPQGETSGVYKKRYLVPFSEFLPEGFLYQWLDAWFVVSKYHFSPGTEPILFQKIIQHPQGEPDKIGLGVLICSEDLFPSLFREYKELKADAIIVLLNDGWFSSAPAYTLHASHSVMHAVQYRMPVIRSSNTGWSSVIDAYGRVSPIEWDSSPEAKVLKAVIKAGYHQVSLKQFGNKSSFLSLIFVIIINVISVKKRKSRA